MSGETIFALASGPPPAGIAVVRLSGPGVRFGLETLAGLVPEPRVATLRPLRSSDGALIDRALVLFFPAPASFTGEDVAELHVHGGRAVVAALLAALAALPGFRMAEPGEFTRRAFANGRMDLTQVEGLADLVASETEAQRRQALRQADGDLGRLYDAWREKIVRSRALIEAELDFPDEDDIPDSVSVQVWDAVAALREEIVNHLRDQRGERIRAGAEIVVLGPPNAGKSSLINAIARRDVAIVTPEAGTTRDLIEVRLDLSGYAATLVDTAGIRKSSSAIEQEGIRRAEARAASADMVVWLTDVTDPNSPAPPKRAIRVGNKIDLIDSAAERSARAEAFDMIISTTTGEGLGSLMGLLTERVSSSLSTSEAPLVTRERHRAALTAAAADLDAALASRDLPLELRAEILRRSGDMLGRITGRIDVDDLLDVIFREFCIGK